MIQESVFRKLNSLLGYEAFEYAAQLLLKELAKKGNLKVIPSESGNIGFDVLLEHIEGANKSTLTAVEIRYFSTDSFPEENFFRIVSRLIETGKVKGATKFLLVTNASEQPLQQYLTQMVSLPSFLLLAQDINNTQILGKESISSIREEMEINGSFNLNDDLLSIFNTLQMYQTVGKARRYESTAKVFAKL